LKSRVSKVLPYFENSGQIVKAKTEHIFNESGRKNTVYENIRQALYYIMKILVPGLDYFTDWYRRFGVAMVTFSS